MSLKLRTLLTVPFLLLLAGTVAVSGWLLIRHHRASVAAVTSQLHREIAHRVDQYLRSHLEVPHRINRLNAALYRQGLLDLRRPEVLARHFWHQVQEFEPAAFVFVATPSGGAVGAGRSSEGRLVVDQTDLDASGLATAGTRREFRAGPSGERLDLLTSAEGFDARRRPWFRGAIASRGEAWSDVYQFFSDQRLAIAASLPVFGDHGRLEAVFATDIVLDGLGSFLSGLDLGAESRSFLIDSSGRLLATSTGEPLWSRPAPEVPPVRRLAVDSSDPLISRAAASLTARSEEGARPRRHLVFRHAGDRHLLDVTPVDDPRGLGWTLAVAVPEAEYLGDIAKQTRTTLALCLAALAAAVWLSVLLARRISRPIARMAAVSEAIASGDLGQTVAEQPIAEIGTLAVAFNTMTERLSRLFSELEDRVVKRTEELRTAKDEAEAANRAKSRFVTVVGHEIRTPLAVILGHSELLTQAGPAHEAELSRRAIRSNGAHLERLIAGLVDLDRLESGDATSEPVPSDLQTLLGELRISFEHMAAQKGLSFEVSAEGEIPWRFTADGRRVKQVLINLVANALKFTSEGGVSLSVSTDGDQPDDEAMLRFAVEDTGPGISEDAQDRLFDWFSRVDYDPESADGFGLGLAIASQLAKRLGGSISVASRLGEGSIFTFALPVTDPEDWAERRHLDPLVTSPSAVQARLVGRALLAEDSVDLAELIKKRLESWGLSVDAVEDGDAALRAATASAYDVLLLDVWLPRLSGIEIARRLQAAGDAPPMIAMTADADPMTRPACAAAGFAACHSKPIDFDRLHAVLGGLLAGRPDEEPAQSAPTGEIDALRRAYLAKLPGQVDQLRDLLERSRWSEADSRLHRLAGTSGSFGIDDVHQAALELERAVATRSRESCMRGADRLARLVDSANVRARSA